MIPFAVNAEPNTIAIITSDTVQPIPSIPLTLLTIFSRTEAAWLVSSHTGDSPHVIAPITSVNVNP